MSFWTRHQIFEKNSIILVAGILVVIAIGGLVEITPLFYLKSTIEKVDGVRPYTPLELAGRNIYVREGCYLCHSQMVRPLRDEVERPESLRVTYRDLHFDPQVLEVDGLLGRVILHEIDHLNGVLLLDHLEADQRKEAKKQVREMMMGERAPQELPDRSRKLMGRDVLFGGSR